MKKFFKAISCIIAAFMFCLPAIGCKSKTNKDVIRLCEVTHSIFYAPLYVAINEGYFDEYGIKIQLTNGNGSNNVMTAIASKSADVGLMGPEATV